VSSVTTMKDMFIGNGGFTGGNIASWDVSSVTSTGGMFAHAPHFSADLSSWNVSAVTHAFGMFWNAATFRSDLSAWDMPISAAVGHMFKGATAWLDTYVNCGLYADSFPDVCTYDTYPTPAAEFDGPPAAWHARHCVITAPIDGSLGSCGTTLARSSHCVPACDAPEAMAQPARCDAHAQLKKALACLCTCEEKAARFGFVVPKKK
jgi:hypothetical protein